MHTQPRLNEADRLVRGSLFGKLDLKLTAQGRDTALVVWLAAIAAVAIFGSEQGLIVGLPVLLAAGALMISLFWKREG